IGELSRGADVIAEERFGVGNLARDRDVVDPVGEVGRVGDVLAYRGGVLGIDAVAASLGIGARQRRTARKPAGGHAGDQVTTRPRTGRDAPKTANRKAEGPEGEGRELRFPGLRRRLDHDGGLSSAGASWVKHESTRPDARAGPRLARRGQ